MTMLGLVDVTPEHAFAFMLHDRIEALEDRMVANESSVSSIQSKITSWVPYEWINFKFQLPVSSETSEDMIDTFRIECVNSVFQKRAFTNPLFAYWSWRITAQDNMYELHVFVRFGNPCTFESFDFIKQNVSFTMRPLQGGPSEMKMIIKDRLGFSMSFPYTTSELGVEIWRKGGDGYDHCLDEDWSTVPFIFSKNYKVSVGEFYLVRDRILQMVRTKRWLELFRMDYY